MYCAGGGATAAHVSSPLSLSLFPIRYLRIESSFANAQDKTLQVSSTPKQLASFLDPPTARSVAAAERVLRDVGALTEEGKLTPLGHHIAHIPVDLRLAKMLL